jgi:nuclear GTP-binding protein
VLKDWNHQKIPYFSVPPPIHPSSVPAAHPAPGAEQVGQAQILAGLSKPFELEGLFVAADSGAFDGKVGVGAEEDEKMEGVVDVNGCVGMIAFSPVFFLT